MWCPSNRNSYLGAVVSDDGSLCGGYLTPCPIKAVVSKYSTHLLNLPGNPCRMPYWTNWTIANGSGSADPPPPGTDTKYGRCGRGNAPPNERMVACIAMLLVAPEPCMYVSPLPCADQSSAGSRRFALPPVWLAPPTPGPTLGSNGNACLAILLCARPCPSQH